MESSTEVVLAETLDTAKKDLEAKDTVIRRMAVSRDVERSKSLIASVSPDIVRYVCWMLMFDIV